MRFSVRNVVVFSWALPTKRTPSFALEALEVLVGDVVLALALLEPDQVDPLVLAEALDVLDEALGERVHEGRGGEGVAQVAPEEADDTHLVLEFWHVHVEVHPIDGLDLEGHVVAQHVGHTAR